MVAAPRQAERQAPGLDQQLGHYGVDKLQVLEQTRRRVVLGESVPNAEKVFSIFEPHTELTQSRR